MGRLNTVSSGRLNEREGDDGNVVLTFLYGMRKKWLVKKRV